MSDEVRMDEQSIKAEVEQDVAEERAAHAESTKKKIDSELIIQCLYNNEVGDRDLFCELFRGHVAYDHLEDAWYLRNGSNWQPDKTGEHFSLFDQLVAVYQKEKMNQHRLSKELLDEEEQKSADRRAKTLGGRISKLNSSNRRSAVVRLIKSGQGNLAVSGEHWDPDPWVLGVANGVVDLRTGELRPSRAEDWIRTAVPIEYDPDAKCPKFEEFVRTIMDDDEQMATYLLRVLGLALVGRVIKDHFFVLAGEGGNGKTVLIELLYDVLGQVARPIQASLLLDQGKYAESPGKPQPEILDLMGLRIACASETKDGQKFDPARVKWLSGGDKLKGRPPHQKRYVEFSPSHTLILLTNDLPSAPPTDYGFWRRCRVIWFPIQFVAEPKLQHERKAKPKDALEAELRAEAKGILALLVRSCLQAQQPGGLDEPPKVAEATAQYRQDVDTLGTFLGEVADYLPDNPDARETAGDLYIAYELWCRSNNLGRSMLSGVKFGKAMAKRLPKYESSVNYYLGVLFKDEWADKVNEEKERRKKKVEKG